MGLVLFICLSAFLILFAANNEMAAVLSSPLALLMVAGMLAADLYLLRSLLREWSRKRR
jgi:hypothetical protein